MQECEKLGRDKPSNLCDLSLVSKTSLYAAITLKSAVISYTGLANDTFQTPGTRRETSVLFGIKADNCRSQ